MNKEDLETICLAIIFLAGKLIDVETDSREMRMLENMVIDIYEIIEPTKDKKNEH